MFAYCQNNPVNGCDPCGTCFHRWDFWNECEECRFARESATKTTDVVLPLTVSCGLAGNVGIGPWVWGAQVFITLDSNGYSALQYGGYGGISGGSNSDKFSASWSPFVTVMNAPSYRSLEGNGLQAGASLLPYAVDYVAALDESIQEVLYSGISISGFSDSLDAHIYGSYTYTWFAVEFDWERFYHVTQY